MSFRFPFTNSLNFRKHHQSLWNEGTYGPTVFTPAFSCGLPGTLSSLPIRCHISQCMRCNSNKENTANNSTPIASTNTEKKTVCVGCGKGKQFHEGPWKVATHQYIPITIN